MGQDDAKHVFVSYVREDSRRVDRLCKVLEAAQIPYWRDRKALGPGDTWKAKIRSAIRDEALVFLACFSDNSRARSKSHMNEELTLAVEEFRKMPPGRVWLIPVRFDTGDIPEWDLGAGRVLGDLNFVDLFGTSHPAQSAALVTTIHRLMGEKRPSPATALAAVDEASEASRTSLLKQLTKEMVLDPSRRIELNDLVRSEVSRIKRALVDPQAPPTDRFSGTNDEQLLALVDYAKELWRVTEPFCQSLQVACRWAPTDALDPWSTGVRVLVSAACKPQGGHTVLLDLRHLPAVTALMTAGLACSSAARWDNLKALVVDPRVRDRHSEQPVSLIEATDPYTPFGSAVLASNVLARSTAEDVSPAVALSYYETKSGGKYFTPFAEWLHHSLRSLFADQLLDDDHYDDEFDRAEIMLGLLSQDCANQRVAASGSTWRARSRWFGRSTWRYRHSSRSPLMDFEHELQSNGPSWAPVQQNLFGGEENRAREALNSYGEDFRRISRSNF